jgi:hypothetical protein
MRKRGVGLDAGMMRVVACAVDGGRRRADPSRPRHSPDAKGATLKSRLDAVLQTPFASVS